MVLILIFFLKCKPECKVVNLPKLISQLYMLCCYRFSTELSVKMEKNLLRINNVIVVSKRREAR